MSVSGERVKHAGRVWEAIAWHVKHKILNWAMWSKGVSLITPISKWHMCLTSSYKKKKCMLLAHLNSLVESMARTLCCEIAPHPRLECDGITSKIMKWDLAHGRFSDWSPSKIDILACPVLNNHRRIIYYIEWHNAPRPWFISSTMKNYQLDFGSFKQETKEAIKMNDHLPEDIGHQTELR